MHFVKMEGCGNDYIYLDGEKEAISNPQALARKISDRHFGVGADGMILICPSDTADCRMEMYNADGSRGSMCGNGVRCVARYLYDYKQIKKQEIAVETDSGIHTVRVLKDSEKGKVSMGRPVILDQSHIISLEGQKLEMMLVSMGNPHAVIFMPPEGSRYKQSFGLPGRGQRGTGAGVFGDRNEDSGVGARKQGDAFLWKWSVCGSDRSHPGRSDQAESKCGNAGRNVGSGVEERRRNVSHRKLSFYL